MITNQQLLSELSNIVSQIKCERDEESFRLQLDMLLEKYEIWPSLHLVHQSLTSSKEIDTQTLFVLEQHAQIEINQIYEAILFHCQQNGITLSKHLKEDYERKIVAEGIEHKIPIALNLTIHCFLITRDIILFLLQKDVLLILIKNETAKLHIEFIRTLATLNATGNIEKCIFSPSYDQWVQKKKNYSIMLYGTALIN